MATTTDFGTVVEVSTVTLGDELAAAVSAPTVVNLSTNPSAGLPPSGWAGTGTATQDSTRALFGTTSFKLSSGGAFKIWITGAPPNTPYTLSCHLWIPSTETGSPRIRAGSTGFNPVVNGPIVTERDQWVRTSVTATTDADGGNVAMYPAINAVGNVWVDGIMITQGSTLTAYGDGDQPGWAWDGTPHASTSRTTVSSAAPAGSTVLRVKDAVDFADDGGWLTIGTETIYYTTAEDDEDNDVGILTLSTPLASTYDEGERVTLDPPSYEKYAQVMIGDFGEAQQAVVPHTLWDKIGDGIRPDGEGEVVALGLQGSEFVIADVVGSEPVIDGSYLDPEIPLDPVIVPAVDPPPPPVPSNVPTPSLTGSVGALFLHLDPVTNPAGTVADVWVGSSVDYPTGAIPLDATTYHGEAVGTTYVIEKLTDGTLLRDLPADTTYYVVVRTRNVTGDGPQSAEVSAQTRPVDAADFAVGYLYAGAIDVTQLTGGTFNLSEGEVSVIEAVSAATGAKVGMSGTDGFYVLGAPEVTGQQGPTLVEFPINGKPNIISGQLQATSLTTTTDATFNGTTTVAPGGTLVLGGQVQAPKAAPSAVASYDTVQFSGGVLGAPGWTYAGLTLGHDGNWWTVGNLTGSTSVTDKFSSTGAWTSGPNLPAGYSYAGGIVYASHNGGRYYLLAQKASDSKWYIEARDTSFALLSRSSGGTVFTVSYGMALGWDHVNSRLLVANWGDNYGPSSTGAMSIRSYTVDAAGAFTFVSDWNTPSGYSYPYALGYVGRVTTEYGDRYIFRRSGSLTDTFQVFTTAATPVHQTSEEWPTANGTNVRGAWYDGTRFHSLASTGQKLRYEYGDGRHMWDSGSAVREVSYTWYDSAGTTHETTPSPKASVTMPKRARLSITTQAIPTGAGGVDDPNASRIYVGRGIGVANGSMNLEKTLTTPATAWSTDSTVAQESVTTHPPTSNDFGTAAASSLVTTSGGVIIRSDGTGDVGTAGFRDSVRAAVIGNYTAPWTAYTPTFTAATTNPTTANFTRTGRYAQRGKWVTFTIVITCNAASGFGTGNYSFGLPVTARNLDEVVVIADQSGPNHKYIGRSGDGTTVSLFLTSTDGAMDATSSGMANGTKVRINGTYEAA